MREILLPWYAEHVGEMAPHETIGGGYTNSHVVRMSKLDMDSHRAVRRALVSEMRDVLEWWTGRSLVHTSTFGVRIYHRGSMLINHVDRPVYYHPASSPTTHYDATAPKRYRPAAQCDTHLLSSRLRRSDTHLASAVIQLAQGGIDASVVLRFPISAPLRSGLRAHHFERLDNAPSPLLLEGTRVL